MKKLIINIQKHVFPVFLAVLLIFATVVGFSTPVSAASNDKWDEKFPIGVIVNDAATVPFPDSDMTINCNGSVYPLGGSSMAINKILITTGNRTVEFFYNFQSVAVFCADGVIAGVSYFSLNSLADSSTAVQKAYLKRFIQSVGTPVWFEGSYTFKNNIEYSVELNFSCSFVSNGTSWSYMSTKDPYDNLNYSTSSSVSDFVTVYRRDGSGVDSGWVDPAYRTVVFTERFVPFYPPVAEFLYENEVIPPSPFDPITNALTAVIGWVGAVVSAIFGGELSGLMPLVVVGIAVSVLLLAWVFIRRSIWGS